MDASLVTRAEALINKLQAGYSEKYGYGSMSCTVYDSAWVAQISKPGHAKTHNWLFSECFEYILESQKPDGSFVSYASEIDGILNTAASLLALHAHSVRPLQITAVSSEDLKSRVENGTAALSKMLNPWDVASTEHVAFEILVPIHLELLEKAGICFQFPQKDLLMKIRDQKMKRFKPEADCFTFARGVHW